MYFVPTYARFSKALIGIAALAAILGILAFIDPALAQTDDLASVGTSAGYSSDTDLMEIIGRIISIVLGSLGVIFLILLVYSGWVWMTAGGDAERVKKAQRILINATIGIIVVVMAYAITTFIIGALGDATNNDSGSNGSVSVEVLSGSLGGGPVRDHYPSRNASGVARNTRIMVTFKEAMDTSALVDADGNLNTDNVHIFDQASGEEAFLTAVSVTYTEDEQTFVFDPDEYLGSATADSTYTVSLSNSIRNADGENVFTGSYAGGYEWSFEVSTELDLTPPSVVSVNPVASSEYDRNIAVEITFSEAMDPTSTTGTREAESGFDTIQTVSASDTAPVAGTYVISNRYRTITFTSADACGTNSCGETIYCLPGSDTITVTAYAATVGDDAPQAVSLDGIVDTSFNSLDANGDGTAGDDYTWSFTTSDDINLEGASIELISPNILEEGVALDQDIEITFSDVMMTSTLTSDNITMENSEQTSGDVHEMWYVPSSDSLTSDNEEVTSTSQTTAKTRATLEHGVFLESTGGLTYLYGVSVGEGVRNQYQNCYSPAEGPVEDGGACGVDSTSPSCCNGSAQSASCDFFTE